MHALSRIAFLMTISLAALMLPHHAFARGLKDDASDDFADSKPVTDKEMSKMRGGFIDINGMLVSFAFNSVSTINGNIQNNVHFTDADLQQLGSHIPPAIVQNTQNNVTLGLNNVIDITVANAGAAAASHVFSLVTSQNALAFH